MSQEKLEYLYVLGDGDKIRERVEHYLLSDEIEPLTKLSQAVTDAINAMKSSAISVMDAKIIMAGGDDILFRVDTKKYKQTHLQNFSEAFFRAVGCTFSFGVGKTIEDAYINLRRAKSSGSVRIVAGRDKG